MYNLFVGDVDSSLASHALQFDSKACLLTASNCEQLVESGTYYTCIADLESLDKFFSVCSNARKIFYYPPPVWTSLEQKQYTEMVLAYVSQSTVVHNVDLISSEYQFLKQDFLSADRCSEGQQLWFAGCSITHGIGVDPTQTFKHLLEQHYCLPSSDLSCPSSSIIWQSDQICRSDIRSGDKVFWGVTGNFRLPVIQNQKLVHLMAGSYNTEPVLLNEFPIEILSHASTVYHNVLAVRRAENFCKKVGAEIVMLGVLYDWDNLFLNYQVPCFKQSVSWPNGWADLGNDNAHPGPQQHQLFAKEFIDLHNKMYAPNYS